MIPNHRSTCKCDFQNKTVGMFQNKVMVRTKLWCTGPIHGELFPRIQMEAFGEASKKKKRC